MERENITDLIDRV